MRYHKGHKFGDWEFLGIRIRPAGVQKMLCRCKCGAEQMVRCCNLYNGTSKRCMDCARKVTIQRLKSDSVALNAHRRFEKVFRKIEAKSLWSSYQDFRRDLIDVDLSRYPYPKRWNILKPYSKRNIFFSVRPERIPKRGSPMQSGRFAWHNSEWGHALGVSAKRVRQMRTDGILIDEMRERFGCTDDSVVIRRVLKANQ